MGGRLEGGRSRAIGGLLPIGVADLIVKYEIISGMSASNWTNKKAVEGQSMPGIEMRTREREREGRGKNETSREKRPTLSTRTMKVLSTIDIRQNI